MDTSAQLSWTALVRLLPTCVSFYETHCAGEAIDPREVARAIARAFGIEDIDAYASEKVQQVLNEALSEAFSDEDAAALSILLAGYCERIMEYAVAFACGDGSDQDAESFLAGLADMRGELADALESGLAHALGLPKETSESLSEALGALTVSIYCFAAAYRLYRKASDDAVLAREHRLEIERLSSEALSRLKAQRKEMSDTLHKYLLDRLTPFQQGVAAFDEAMLSNDDEGFIRANVRLQNLFGKSAAYHSVGEFEDLMQSDEPLRL